MSYGEPPNYGSPPPPPPPGGGQPPYGGGQPPYGGQPGYGYGYGGAPQGGEHPRGTLILVLGILSILCCGPLGIVSWVMGKKALDESRTQHYSNEGVIKAGYICGIIGVVLMIVGVVGYGLLIATGGMSNGV